MKKKALCLIFGTALAGAICVASAEEPQTLSMEQMDQVTAAGGGVVNIADGLNRLAEFRSGLASTLFASLSEPTDETVESPFGTINRKITEIRERDITRDIKFTLGATKKSPD